MSIPELVTVIVAITPLVVGIAALLVQQRRTHELVNHRMTELLELTRKSARAEGKLDSESWPTAT